MNKNLITITSLASKKLKQIIINEKAKGMMFYIERGPMVLVTNLNPWIFLKIKIIFIIKDRLTVELCDKSLFYVLGTKIDWKEDMMGSNFSFDNPVAQASCGCGTSFTLQ